MKVNVIKVNSASVRVNNSESELAITANVQIDETNNVNNIDGGSVVKDGRDVANFSAYGDEQLYINFFVADAKERVSIMGEVNEFIAAARTDLRLDESITVEVANTDAEI